MGNGTVQSQPPRAEVASLIEQIEACSADEKRLLLAFLLRNVYGDRPPLESAIYNEDGSEYAFLLEPEYRIRLFVTPERLAVWAAQDRSKCRPLSEVNALLERGDEEEIKAYLASLNS